MKISLVTLVTALLWISLMPVDAQTIYYPTQRCRVYYDTAYYQNSGSVWNGHAFLPTQTVFANVKGSRCITITRIVADID